MPQYINIYRSCRHG